MRLYLIKRRSDSKFFVEIKGHCILHSPHRKDWAEYWSDTGRFLRTPEGVAGNLRKLCSKPYWDRKAPPGTCRAVAAGWKEIAWHKFDKRKLKKYEVVVMDVDIVSMTATPADKFIQISTIRNQPLTRKERQAA